MTTCTSSASYFKIFNAFVIQIFVSNLVTYHAQIFFSLIYNFFIRQIIIYFSTLMTFYTQIFISFIYNSFARQITTYILPLATFYVQVFFFFVYNYLTIPITLSFIIVVFISKNISDSIKFVP